MNTLIRGVGGQFLEGMQQTVSHDVLYVYYSSGGDDGILCVMLLFNKFLEQV